MGLANRAGVIILYVVFYMPMNVLLYSGYLTNIPLALEEAACVDGASTWKTYWKIVFPIMKPMHATVAVLTALGTWNDVMTPLVIMSGSGSGNTLPLAQLNFQTQFGTNYNLAFASYLLALLPILIFYLICQIRHHFFDIFAQPSYMLHRLLIDHLKSWNYLISDLISCKCIVLIACIFYPDLPSLF